MHHYIYTSLFYTGTYMYIINDSNFPILIAVRKRDINPGPAYYIDPKITKTGADGTPIYSMLARQRDPSKYTPC